MTDAEFRAEARRLWNLPTVRDLPGWQRKMPAVKLRRSTTKNYSTGRAWTYSYRLVVTAPVNGDTAQVRKTLLHELLHLAFMPSEGHSARYWSAFRSAAKEAWPDVPFNFAGRTTNQNRGWKLGSYIANEIRKAG